MLPSVFGEKLFDDMFNDAFTLVPAFAKNASIGSGIKNLMKTDVRELENTLHRAVLLSTGNEIGEDAVILDSQDAVINRNENGVMTGAEFVGNTVASVERNLIIDTLKHTMGNRTTAANILGISIRTLRNKLKQYQNEGFDIPEI